MLALTSFQTRRFSGFLQNILQTTTNLSKLQPFNGRIHCIQHQPDMAKITEPERKPQNRSVDKKLPRDANAISQPFIVASTFILFVGLLDPLEFPLLHLSLVTRYIATGSCLEQCPSRTLQTFRIPQERRGLWLL